jgi:hypothetical protein
MVGAPGLDPETRVSSIRAPLHNRSLRESSRWQDRFRQFQLAERDHNIPSKQSSNRGPNFEGAQLGWR